MLSVELDSIKVQPASDLMAGLVRQGRQFSLESKLANGLGNAAICLACL